LNKKAIPTILLTLMLTSMLTLAFDIQLVTATEAYIVATGAVPDSIAYPSQRKLAVTSDGHLHAVYHRQDGSGILQIYHAESADGGKTWTEEPVTNAGRDQNLPALAVDSTDNLHMVWQDGTHSMPGIVPYTYYQKKTTSWQGAELVASYASMPSIAVDSNDDVHVVYGAYVYSPGYYGGGEGIRWRKRTSNGWQPQEIVSSISMYYERYPAIAIDGNNDVHVVWNHAPAQYYDVHYRKRSPSGWGPEMEVNTQKGGFNFPSIAIDNNNYVHIVWNYMYVSSGDIYSLIKYRKYTTSWQPVDDITEPTTGEHAQIGATIAIDGNDHIHVVWSSQNSGSPAIYQIRYREYTTSWQPIEELTASTLYNQTYPSLMWAFYPIINGVKTNQPEDGYAFIWMDGTAIKYWTPTPPTPDFLITASPTSLTIEQGNSDTSIITVTSLRGFNHPVDLSVTSAPILGVITTLNPSQVIPPADSFANSILTVSVATTATPGSYTLTVTGTSGTLIHSVDISLEITVRPTPEWTFAIITDLHIGRGYSDYGGKGIYLPEDAQDDGQDYYLTDRLNKTVEWIIENQDGYGIKFAVVLGDLSDSGEYSELRKAKGILDRLNDANIPYVPVIGNHDTWPYTEDEEAQNLRYFEYVFGDQFSLLSDDLRFHLQFQPDRGELLNYRFTYNGIDFIALDFNSREPAGKGVKPEAVPYEVTLKWLGDSLNQAGEKPVVLLSHHPLIWKEYPEIEELIATLESYKPALGASLSLIKETILQKLQDTFDEDNIATIGSIIEQAQNSLGTNVVANFAGHVHGWSDWYEVVKIEVGLSFFFNANVDYREDTATYRIEVSLPLTKLSFDVECIGHVPADIPVATTEALMVGSNEPTPKGSIRIVKVSGDSEIEKTFIDGEFRALNPYFKEIDVELRPALKLPPWKWVIEVEAYAFTKRFSEERPGTYILYIDGVKVGEKQSERWDAAVQFESDFKGNKDYDFSLIVKGYTPDGKEEILENINQTRHLRRPPFVVGTFSPVDITVTDPEGRTISKQLNEIPGATYLEVDLDEDGDLDDLVLIEDPLVGNYVVMLIGTASGTYSVTTELVTPQETITQTFTGETVEGAIYVYNITITDEAMTAKPDPIAELNQLKIFLNGLPSSVFDERIMSASKMKKVLSSKIDEIIVKVQVGNYTQAIDKLRYDIRAKMDGDSTARDWIIDPATQFKLCIIIDHIIESIRIPQENN